MKIELKVDDNSWEVNVSGENPMQLMDQGIKQMASAVAANSEAVKDMVDKISAIKTAKDQTKDSEGQCE